MFLGITNPTNRNRLSPTTPTFLNYFHCSVSSFFIPGKGIYDTPNTHISPFPHVRFWICELFLRTHPDIFRMREMRI